MSRTSLWGLIAVAIHAGCWGGARGAATPSPRDARPGAARTTGCHLEAIAGRAERGSLNPGSRLVFVLEGAPFASIYDDLQHVTLELVGDHARGRVESLDLELSGHVDATRLSVYLRTPGRHDGWLGIRDGHPVRAVGAELDLKVALPAGVVPRDVTVRVPCDALALAWTGVEDDEDAATGGGEADGVVGYAEVPVDGRAPLARAPGGPVVATIAPREADPQATNPVVVTVLERRGAHLRVFLAEDNSIEGWIPAAATRPTSASPGGFGWGRSGFERPAVRCGHPVPIYALPRSGRIQRVGQYKPGAAIRGGGAPHDGRVSVDLGGEVPVFVEADQLADCQR